MDSATITLNKNPNVTARNGDSEVRYDLRYFLADPETEEAARASVTKAEVGARAIERRDAALAAIGTTRTPEEKSALVRELKTRERMKQFTDEARNDVLAQRRLEIATKRYETLMKAARSAVKKLEV